MRLFPHCYTIKVPYTHLTYSTRFPIFALQPCPVLYNDFRRVSNFHCQATEKRRNLLKLMLCLSSSPSGKVSRQHFLLGQLNMTWVNGLLTPLGSTADSSFIKDSSSAIMDSCLRGIPGSAGFPVCDLGRVLVYDD